MLWGSRGHRPRLVPKETQLEGGPRLGMGSIRSWNGRQCRNQEWGGGKARRIKAAAVVSIQQGTSGKLNYLSNQIKFRKTS